MIKQKISTYLAHHELILEQLLATSEIPSQQLREAIHYSLFPGGKRLRPVLVYLCGEMLGTNPRCLDLIAAAIEFTHCYSLVHDDLPAMDNDDLRRGKPSCHKAFDEATAILVGDGLQALAIEILVSHLPHTLSSQQVIAVTHELVKASGIGGMISGQSLDLLELTNPHITEEKLRQIHALKTGKLFSACVNMVILASECNKNTASALQNFVHYLGLVFQLQDDYLDRYAAPEVIGKNRASDLANQKMTFSDRYGQKELAQLINQLFQKVKDALELLGESKNYLLEFTNYLQQRTMDGME